MSFKLIYAKHSCGYVEENDSVEIGEHVHSDDEVHILSHLRVKHCPQCKNRGTWSWTEPKVVVSVKDKLVAKAKSVA